MTAALRSGGGGRASHRAAGLFAGVAMLAAPLAGAATSEPDAIDEISEVVITGSRIPMPAQAPLAPVIVLDRSDIERGNADSIGELLQTLPGNTGSPMNANVDNGGDGSVRLDLRGLGPARTLVLLNGRRLPNGGIGADSSVDLNSIPVSMIERVEVLTSGASAVYGADAISGVVNIITRSGFRGIELDASQSESSHWDGRVTRLQALAGGGEEGRPQGMIGVDYTKQVAVTADRRGYSALPLTYYDTSGVLHYQGAGATAYGPTLVPAGNSLGLSEDFYALNPGTSGRSAGDYHSFTAADSFNYEPYTYLQTPNERASLWTQGSLPLGDVATLFAEGTWSYRRSSQRLAPSLYGTDFDAAPQLADGSQGIPANNYYNPFGVDIPFLRRRFTELNDRGFAQDVQQWRTVVGVRTVLNTWHLEAAAGYADSRAVVRESGLIATQRLLPAIAASGQDAAGQIVCGTPDASGIVPAASVIPGCTPLNLFGGPGAISPAQIAALELPLKDHGDNSQRLLELSAQGDWGTVSGQPVSWATGATYEREAGAYRYDPLREGGVVGSTLSANVPGGQFDSEELYAEARVPLLKELPGIQKLEFSAGARYSHFSSFGDHVAWQGGLHWEPLPLLSLRANYGTVFRAPALSELYQAQVRALDNETVDPCGNMPTAAQRTRCAAQGVPGGSYAQNPNVGIATLTGGNPQLTPERGTAFDAGADLHWDGALRGKLSIDFFRTALRGFISQADNNTLLEQCIDENLAAACSHIVRNSDGTIQGITATQQNFGRIVVRGLDFGADFSRDTSVGRIQFGALATWLAHRDKQTFDDSTPVNTAGQYDEDLFQAFPHWRSLGHLTFKRGPWQFSYAVQYIGGLIENVFLDAQTIYRHPLNSVTYHDVECGYEIFSHGRLRVGVSNLTGADPPFVAANGGGNTDVATYRLLGRTYFVDARFQLN